MVKTSSKKKMPQRAPHNAVGRPAKDPGDLRIARTAMRLHPDLVAELDMAAREARLNRSVYVERILVNFLNMHAERRERPPLDDIGRYLTEEAIERMHRTALPSSYANLRASSSPDADYVMPSVSAFGFSRRLPSGPKPPASKPARKK
jgi:hypothetical protein